MSDTGVDVDWSKTTWEGSRREQLRRSRKLSLREKMLAVEELADLSRHLEDMRHQRHPGKPKNPAGENPGGEDNPEG